MKVCIIGGSGVFGQWYASLFGKAGFEVAINNRHASVGKKVARQLGVSFEPSFSKAVAGADWVMVSVPIASTPRYLLKASRHLKKHALLFDVSSVKAGPVRAMRRIAGKKDVELVSIHPMHGPRVKSLKAVPVVFVVVPVILVVKQLMGLPIPRVGAAKRGSVHT